MSGSVFCYAAFGTVLKSLPDTISAVFTQALRLILCFLIFMLLITISANISEPVGKKGVYPHSRH